MFTYALVLFVVFFIVSAALGVPRAFALARALINNIAGAIRRPPAIPRVRNVLPTPPEGASRDIFGEKGIQFDPVGHRILLAGGSTEPGSSHNVSKINSVISETVSGADRVVVEIADPERLVRHIPFFTRKAADEFAEKLRQAIVSAGGRELN